MRVLVTSFLRGSVFGVLILTSGRVLAVEEAKIGLTSVARLQKAVVDDIARSNRHGGRAGFRDRGWPSCRFHLRHR